MYVHLERKRRFDPNYHVSQTALLEESQELPYLLVRKQNNFNEDNLQSWNKSKSLEGKAQYLFVY